jgi:hypothetical protein
MASSSVIANSSVIASDALIVSDHETGCRSVSPGRGSAIASVGSAIASVLAIASGFEVIASDSWIVSGFANESSFGSRETDGSLDRATGSVRCDRGSGGHVVGQLAAS